MKMTINLTEACNISCGYCYYREKGQRSATMKVIKAAVDLSVSRDESSGICFFGGEPLLEKGLIEETIAYTDIIHKETGHKFYYKITTNGTLLDEDFLRLAKRVNMVIAVSHDGLMSAGGRGYTAAATLNAEKLKMLLRYQPYALALTTVNPHGVGLFADSVEWLFERGFRYLITSPAHGMHVPWDEKSCDLLQKEYQKIAKLYMKWTQAGEKFYLGAFETKIASHIKGESHVQKHCHIGKEQISVAVDGKIYPCVQFVEDADYCIGDVWSGLDARRQQALVTRHCGASICEGCAISNRCIHTCGCMNSLDTGSANRVSPFQCRHEKMLISIVDKMAEKLYRSGNRRFIAKHYDPAYPLISLIEDGLRRV